MSPQLRALALDLVQALKDAKDDPAAVDRIGKTVDRILHERHPQLLAHERAAAAREAS